MQFSFDSTRNYSEDYVIEYLKSCEPEQKIFKCTDKYENTLLHIFASKKYQKLQDYILSECPEIIYTRNHLLETPLMSAVNFRNDMLVKKILRLDPELLYLTNVHGICAFEKEIRISGENVKVLREMLSNYDYNRINLSYILTMSMMNSLNKTTLLLENNFDYVGFNGTNDEGKLPLHFATALSYEQFKKVYDAFPEGIYTQDKVGNTPLHTMIKYNYSDVKGVILSEMLTHNPESFLIKNKLKSTVVHEICYYKEYNWWENIDLIMRKYPHLIFEKDHKGLSPLDYGTEDVGKNRHERGKFLITCLKYTPIDDKYWDIFHETCPEIINAFGFILERSEAEASKAARLLPNSSKRYLYAIIRSLKKYNLEKEHIDAIISHALKN